MILNINDLVEVHLLPGISSTDGFPLLEEYSSYFTMEMSPMYASTYDVRRFVGAFVTEIPEDVINQLILEWSLTAEDLSNCIGDEKWTRYTNKWVTYKVALIILYNTEEFRGASSDKKFKQLGDFSISSGGGTSDSEGVSKMIDWLECEAFKYEFSVRTCESPAMNCLGLTDNSAVPYVQKVSELTNKGLLDVNRPVVGRRWASASNCPPRGNNTLYHAGRQYKTNVGGRGF